MVNERRGLIFIFALYFLLGIGYSLLMPIWEAPDEGAHYHVGWHLMRYDEYPSLDVNYEAHQPRAFYYLGSWVLETLNDIDPEYARYTFPEEFTRNIRVPERRFDWTDENYIFLPGVYVLRWINLIFGGFALWLNWKTFKLIAPDQPTLCLAALALAALTPQYLHIMSSVNNDALGTLAGALLIYLMIRFLVQPTILLGLLTITLALLLPVLTKLTVLPASAAALLIIGWKWLFGFRQKRWLIYSGGLILMGVGLLYVLFPEIIQSAVSEIQWRLFSFRRNALTSEYIKTITSQLLWTYWGKVGWLAVGLPFWFILLLSGFGFIGTALHAYRLIKQRMDHPQFALWFAVGLIAAFTVLAVFRNGLTTFGAQGRLLFPAIGALSLLMISGWHDVSSLRLQRYLPALIITLFIVCNLYIWLTGVLPIYYQPFFD